MLHIAVGANTHSINNGASGQTGKVLPVMMILAKEKKIRQDSHTRKQEKAEGGAARVEQGKGRRMDGQVEKAMNGETERRTE